MSIIEKLEEFQGELEERRERITEYLNKHLEEDTVEYKGTPINDRLGILHHERMLINWYLDVLRRRINLEKKIAGDMERE